MPVEENRAGKPVVIWVDSFSDCFTGGGVEAMVAVLESAGYAPRFLAQDACCGLTWISTGQREGARRQLAASLDVLHPIVAAGTPVVGLEPSCPPSGAATRPSWCPTIRGWPRWPRASSPWPSCWAAIPTGSHRT